MYVCMNVWMNAWLNFPDISTYLEPQPITHIFLEKIFHHILKQINHFAWRYEVHPLNHFSYTKFNLLRWPNFQVNSMNMKFNILARSWKFKKYR